MNPKYLDNAELTLKILWAMTPMPTKVMKMKRSDMMYCNGVLKIGC